MGRRGRPVDQPDKPPNQPPPRSPHASWWWGEMLRLGQSLQLDGALGNAPHLHFIAPASAHRPDPWPAGRRTAGTDVGGEAHLELAPDISARRSSHPQDHRGPRL